MYSNKYSIYKTYYRYWVYLLVIISILLLLYSCSNSSDDNCNCDLEPDQGLCEAAIPKYYFDQEEKKCKVFIWGGCGGVVPFGTLEECEECGCN